MGIHPRTGLERCGSSCSSWRARLHASSIRIRRGDFSRWIGDVFGDRSLAVELDKLEAQHRLAPRAETIPEIVGAIRARYDVTDDETTSARS